MQVRRVLRRRDRSDALPEVHGELHVEDVEHPRRRAGDVDGLGGPVSTRVHESGREGARARAPRLRPAQVPGPHARQRHRLSGVPRSRDGTRCGARWSPARAWSTTPSSASATSTSSRTSCWARASTIPFADYHTVFCSIDLDALWGEDTLPYTGRMMIPLLIPGLAQAFPGRRGVAALFVLRVPDARDGDEGDHAARQPRHADSHRGARAAGSREVLSAETPSDYALANNLLAEKAYPQQSAQAFATYRAYVDRGRKIPNLRYVGRHAEFKYWGMPETVHSAYQKSLEFDPV